MRTKIKYCLLIASVLLMSSQMINGQETVHELTISIGGGMSTLKNKTTEHVRDKKNPLGVNAGIGYTYYLSSNWGIQTGLEYAMYSSKMKIYGLEGSYETKDNEGDRLQYNYKVDGLEEKQNVGYLQIPIMAHFQMPIADLSKFYASAGAKIGLPVKKSFEHTGFVTSGYYPDLNATIHDIGSQGFGDFKNYKTEGDLSLKTLFMISVEAGMKWQLMESLDLHTGVYFEQALNNVNKHKSGDLKSFVGYNEKNPDMPTAVSATEALSGKGKGIVDKLSPMSVGVRIKLGFKL